MSGMVRHPSMWRVVDDLCTQCKQGRLRQKVVVLVLVPVLMPVAIWAVSSAGQLPAACWGNRTVCIQVTLCTSMSHCVPACHTVYQHVTLCTSMSGQAGEHSDGGA